MSGYDASWRREVHDKCVAMGLDPDRDDDCELASRALLNEADERRAKSCKQHIWGSLNAPDGSTRRCIRCQAPEDIKP